MQDLLEELALALIPLGMTPKGFGELVRCAFARAAAQNSKLANGKVNHSRVAAQTGLTRGDVTRLLRSDILHAACADRAPLARVVDGWRTDRRFQNRNGQPKALKISGSGLSFRSLVTKYGGDIPHRAVLHELQRIDAVIVWEGRVKLRVSRTRLYEGFDFRFLTQALGVLVDASGLPRTHHGRASPAKKN